MGRECPSSRYLCGGEVICRNRLGYRSYPVWPPKRDTGLNPVRFTFMERADLRFECNPICWRTSGKYSGTKRFPTTLYFSRNQPINPAPTSMSLHSQRRSSTILGKTEGRWVALCRPDAIRSLPTGMSFNPDYAITGSGVSK